MLKRMSRPPGENLAHRSGVRCDRRSGVVGVHEQREYERTHDPDGNANGARGARGVCRRTGGGEDSHRVACRPAVLARREFPRARGRRGGGWSVVPGRRRGGQGLALYAWSQGDADAWWQHGHRDRPLGGRLRPRVSAGISHAVAAPGAKSGVHTHPGTEAFLVLEGQLSQQTPHGVNVVEAGKTLAGGPRRASDGGHQQRRGRTALADHVRLGCEQAIRVGRYVRVRRLPLLLFGYRSSATVTGGRTDSSGTDCRRDQKNTNHVPHPSR